MLSEEEKKDKYINKLLNFSDETINNAEKLVINKEQAKEFIEELKRDYIPKAIINLEMENFKKHSELTILSAEEKKAIERMYDLIHTCEVGMKKYGKYDDLFEKDKQAIETVLNLIARVKKENESLNKMETTYKLALFMIIRNSTVMPKGIELGKNDKEINEMSYKTLCEALTMIDYNVAKNLYEEGETTFKNNIEKESENE